MGIYLIRILLKVYMESGSNTRYSEMENIDYNDMKALLHDQNLTNDEIDKMEVKIMKYIDSNVFSITYLECLEFVFFDNCLWHRKFKVLIDMGKSILIK